MSFTIRLKVLRRAIALVAVLLATTAHESAAQKDARPAAVQAFDPAECRSDCVIDSLVIDIDRGRRAQAGVVTASLVLLDTIALPKKGAPPTPRDRPVSVWISCDSSPCAAGMLTGRITDRRIDDARVARRVAAVWTLPASLLQKMLRANAVTVNADGRAHPLSPTMMAATHALFESVRATLVATPLSPRALLYIATFATFGVPGDSTMAEDVGTATEPLMIPDATATPPTRVATLTVAGRGADAVAMLVQDDGTGAAPIFGIGETVTISLPGKIGRRGVITAKVAARQRVEAMRDACQGMKIWTYLVSLSASDLSGVTRSLIPSPRPGEAIDRWNGTAVREPVNARMTPVEQRSIVAGRPVAAQFAREHAASGLRAGDVQVLAVLPRSAGLVTNFGVLARDTGGNWRFPSFSLRPATCP